MGGRGGTSGITQTNNTASLPKLKGTEKQIAWAEQIRQDTLGTAERNIKSLEDKIKQYGDIFKPNLAAYKQVRSNLLSALTKIDDASLLIDKRHIFSGETVNREAGKIAEKIRNKKHKR